MPSVQQSPDEESSNDVSCHNSGLGGPFATSVSSPNSQAPSENALPLLQVESAEYSDVQRVALLEEDSPNSWSILVPSEPEKGIHLYSLERRAERMFSGDHLRVILGDPGFLSGFAGFLHRKRFERVALLVSYLDLLKATRAIDYANSILRAMDHVPGKDWAQDVQATENRQLQQTAAQAFEEMVNEDLPAYLAQKLVHIVSTSIHRRITGTMHMAQREASQGLAEVFCLSDPTRNDNPIILASEEFARTTQYGLRYVLGRNCRFLQGPASNPHSVRRLAEAIANAKEHTELLVNYRRDGTAFLNLLLMAPLLDSRGNVRYFLGAQVDVSGLLKDATEIESLHRLLSTDASQENEDLDPQESRAELRDELKHLSVLLNPSELDTIRRHGGYLRQGYRHVHDGDDTSNSLSRNRSRLVLTDHSKDGTEPEQADQGIGGIAHRVLPGPHAYANGRLNGIYKNYLLIRPAPSLRILFASPSMRVPGMLQSPFMHRIGGSDRVRADLSAAFSSQVAVTAQIQWLSQPDEWGEGPSRTRWVHCTPLLHHTGAAGLWMVVLVDGEDFSSTAVPQPQPPPVSDRLPGHGWEQPVPRRPKTRGSAL